MTATELATEGRPALDSREALYALAKWAVKSACEAGADEAAVSVSRGGSYELSRRDQRVEKAAASRSMGLSLEVLVDDRFSSHSTSDLRLEALKVFIRRAIDATRLLEKDKDRRLPERSACGSSGLALDLYDRTYAKVTSEDRRVWAEQMESAMLAHEGRAAMRSTTAQWWDGWSDSVIVYSNGFEAEREGTFFGMGAELTLEDKDGRLPEAMGFYSTRHFEDLPSAEQIAEEAWTKGEERLGSGPTESGRYPLLLDRRAAGRVLGVLLGPMGGASLHQGRSCLQDKIGEQIGPETLSIYDDPTLVRGSRSRHFDGDGFPSIRRAVMENGRLSMYFLGQYHARKLEMEPTTAGASNLFIEQGDRSVDAILGSLPRCIRVDSFLGGNSNSANGDFSFGIRGMLFENGEAVQPVSEMNISGNLFTLLPRFAEAANDTWRYSSVVSPSLLFDDIQFSGL